LSNEKPNSLGSTVGAEMVQESVTWDLRHMTRTPSTSTEIYILFLFIVCIVTSVKLVRIWRTARPFRLSGQAGSPSYLQLLETSSGSLKQWIGSTFLAWGICASINLTDVCSRLFNNPKIRIFEILFIILDFSTALTMALLVVLFLFLVRWHMLKRIEGLRYMPE
jgi:hypothetical protein